MKLIFYVLLPVLGSVPLCSGKDWFNFRAFAFVTEAVTSDWPRFNGPGDDAKSIESPLLEEWLEGAPRLLWSLDKGYGYASPAVCKDILVLFHRRDGKEVVGGRNPSLAAPSGNILTRLNTGTRYGYSAGPRASPVIRGGLVYIHGVTAWLTCLELETGKLVWKA